ncbi:hypothetical protein AB2713_19420 [Citrobacter werkmanii]|uniref:hypothetical protein n=1 Tax=Citrobacter werkmanii TaxID=67827 RepID=UPI0034646EE6
MKMYVSTLNAEVDGQFVKITFSFKSNPSPECTDVKNLSESRAFLNDYISRNVTEGYKHLCIRKEGRAFTGFNDFYKSLPRAVNADTRL